MASQFIVTAAEGGVFTITLDRPAKLNAITPDMHQALHEAFDAFASCLQSRVATHHTRKSISETIA